MAAWYPDEASEWRRQQTKISSWVPSRKSKKRAQGMGAERVVKPDEIGTHGR